MLRDPSRSAEEWRIVCLRYFNRVGAHESGLIGEQPLAAPDNLMPCIVQVATKHMAQLNIFGGDYETPDGTGVRDYVHVMDLAEGHFAAVQFARGNAGWHAINLGTGRGTSVLELISAFEKATGHVIRYQLSSRRAGDVASCFASADLAREKLDWVAKRSLEAMCASAWKAHDAIWGKTIAE